ncbi:hypothetical protein [Bradyrhizobium cenepequi]
MAKTKTISSSTPSFAKGGSTKMFGKQHAGQQAPGQTATKSGAGGKFAKGGSGKMFGKQSVKPSKKQ